MHVINAIRTGGNHFSLNTASLNRRLQCAQTSVGCVALGTAAGCGRGCQSAPMVEYLRDVLDAIRGGFFYEAKHQIIVLRALIADSETTNLIYDALTVHTKMTDVVGAHQQIGRIVRLEMRVEAVPLFVLFVFVTVDKIRVRMLIEGLHYLKQCLGSQFIVIVKQTDELP